MRTLLLPALIAACGPSVTQEPIHETPPPELPPAEPSFLVSETLPPPPPRAAGEPAPAEPVFQQVHRGGILDIDVSPDGSLAALVSEDGSVSVVDSRTGEVRSGRRLWIRRVGGMQARFDPSGTRILLSSAGGENEPGTFYVWDLQSGRFTKGHESWNLRAAALSPDGGTVAYIEREYDSGYYYYNQQASEPAEGREEDGPTTRFGLRSTAGEQRVEVELEGIVPTTVYWTPSGARVVLHDEQEGKLELRDGASGDLVARIEPDDGVLWDVPVFRPNGGAMATVGSDGALRIRDPRTGEVRRTIAPDDDGDSIQNARWTRDGSRLLLGTSQRRIRVLDGSNGAAVGSYMFNGADPSAPFGTAWMPDGSSFYAAHQGGGVTRFNGATGADEGRLPEPAGEQGVFVTMSPDGSLLVVGTSDTVWFVDIQTQRLRASHALGSGEHSVWGVTWRPDGRGLYTWGRAGVEAWDASGARATGCAGPGRMAFSPDGAARYFIQGDYEQGVCNPESGEVHSASVYASSGDGTAYIEVGDEGGFFLVDSRTHTRGRRIEATDTSVSLSHDGRLIVLHTGDEVRVLDARSGRQRGRVATTDLRSVEVARDGRTMLLRFEDRVVLHAATGRSLATFAATEGGSVVAAYSQDGSLIAHAVGNQVTLVTAATGRPRATVNTEGALRNVRFSADGSLLATVTEEGLLQAWATTGLEPRGRATVPPAWYDLSPDGRRVVACARGDLTVTELDSPLNAPGRSIGACATAQEPVFSPDGRAVALRDGAIVHVARTDGSAAATFRTLRLSDGPVLLAYGRDGAFVAPPTALEQIRFRQAGPIPTATLLPAARGPQRPTLLADFFGGS